MEKNTVTELATVLHRARHEKAPIEQLSKTYKDFNEKDAYTIQEEGFSLREKDGERYVGHKMGLTSEAKRKQMNLDSPLYGHLTDKMQLANGEEVDLKEAIHPKIEPEIAFHVSKELSWPVTYDEVLKACDWCSAALEILDSRYTEFKYFSMEDVISDNSSSFLFALGEKKVNPTDLELRSLKLDMKVNGELVREGKSDAISGDPLISVVQQVELLHRRGRSLPAGSLVLAGAATSAVPLEPGMNIELDVENLGSVSVKVKEEKS